MKLLVFGFGVGLGVGAALQLSAEWNSVALGLFSGVVVSALIGWGSVWWLRRSTHTW